MKSRINFVGWARKPLAMLAIAVSLAFGGAGAARADTWDFSYSGSGVSVVGTITAFLNVGGWWDVTALSGTHNGDAITGLWTQSPPPGTGNDNYFIDSAVGAPGSSGWVDPQLDLHFLVGSDQYVFGWVYGQATEAFAPGGVWTPVDYPLSGRCDVQSPGCNSVDFSVPEINASAALQALAVLFGFALLAREMFFRRRRRSDMPALS